MRSSSVPLHVESRSFRRHRRLRQLGYGDYRDYLLSPAWSDVKRRYRQSDLPQMCGCGATTELEMHHKTYERVGEERLEDLAPMCSPCHRVLHVLEARGEIGLEFDPLRDDARAAAYTVLEQARVEKARGEYLRTHRKQDLRRELRSFRKRLMEEAFQADKAGLKDLVQPHFDAISREIDAIHAKCDAA